MTSGATARSNRSGTMTYENPVIQSLEARITQLNVELRLAKKAEHKNQKVIQEKEKEIARLRAKVARKCEDVARVSTVAEGLIAENNERKRISEAYENAAAASHARESEAWEMTRKEQNALGGFAAGAGIGAGAALLVNATVTAVSLPVALAIIGLSAIFGSESNK